MCRNLSYTAKRTDEKDNVDDDKTTTTTRYYLGYNAHMCIKSTPKLQNLS